MVNAVCVAGRGFGVTNTTPSATDGVQIAAGTVSITRSSGGFGTKTIVTPDFYHDFESLSPGASYTAAGLTQLDGFGATPVVATDQAHSGTKSLKEVYAASTETFPQIGLLLANPGVEVYHSCWFRFERTSGTGSPSPILKLSRGGSSQNGGAYHGSPRYYDTVRPSAGNVIGNRDTGWNTPSSGTSYDPRTFGLGALNATFALNSWAFLEWCYKLATPGGSDGFFYTKVNGVINTGNPLQVRNASQVLITPYGKTQDAASTALIDWFILAFDGLSAPGSNAYIGHVDEAYVDTSQSRSEPIKRVIMTDNSTFSSSTKWSMQVPTGTWSDTQIAALLKMGAFGSGETGYFHVGTDVNTTIYAGSAVLP